MEIHKKLQEKIYIELIKETVFHRAETKTGHFETLLDEVDGGNVVVYYKYDPQFREEDLKDEFEILTVKDPVSMEEIPYQIWVDEVERFQKEAMNHLNPHMSMSKDEFEAEKEYANDYRNRELY